MGEISQDVFVHVLTCASMYALAYCASTIYRDRCPYRPKPSFGFLGGISPRSAWVSGTYLFSVAYVAVRTGTPHRELSKERPG